jgi:hypothetical protein
MTRKFRLSWNIKPYFNPIEPEGMEVNDNAYILSFLPTFG